jgi:hypothetical protein
MLTTRLSLSFKRFISRNITYFTFIKKFLSSSLICLLGGFYIGGNLAPILKLMTLNMFGVNQSIFCVFLIFVLEFINYKLVYTKVEQTFLSVIFAHTRNLKQGILLGIFVDAFKVGS